MKTEERMVDTKEIAFSPAIRYCFYSIYQGFRFDRKFRFQFPKISPGEWKTFYGISEKEGHPSKHGNFFEIFVLIVSESYQFSGFPESTLFVAGIAVRSKP